MSTTIVQLQFPYTDSYWVLVIECVNAGSRNRESVRVSLSRKHGHSF